MCLFFYRIPKIAEVEQYQKQQNVQPENQHFPKDKQFVDKKLLGSKSNGHHIDGDYAQPIEDIRAFVAEPFRGSVESDFAMRLLYIRVSSLFSSFTLQ